MPGCWPVNRTPHDHDLSGFRGVAQLVEHRSPKPGVGGSSPSAPARSWVMIRVSGEKLIKVCLACGFRDESAGLLSVIKDSDYGQNHPR